MVIDDGYPSSPRIRPLENDTPLVVDPDGMEAGELAFEGFQAISWRHFQVVQRYRLIQLDELTQRHSCNGGELSIRFGAEQLFRVSVIE